MYFPFDRQPGFGTTLFVRTSSSPESIRHSVEGALRALEPKAVIANVRTLDDVAADSVAVTTFALWMLGLFAILALTLAAVGIYGVMAYTVRQRTREIGMRIALGATSRDIAWMLVRQGGGIAAAGLFAGLMAGLGASRALGGLLYGVSGTDPAALTGASVVLLAKALVACYVPARRAARLDAARTLAGAE